MPDFQLFGDAIYLKQQDYDRMSTRHMDHLIGIEWKPDAELLLMFDCREEMK